MDWLCMHIAHCTIAHVFFPHRYWHFYGTCWSFDVFPSLYGWGQHTFKLYFWDPFHIEVNAERKIMIINNLTSIDIMILWPLLTLIKNYQYPIITIAQIIISSLHFVDLGWRRRSRGFCLSRVWRIKIAFSSAQEKGYCRFCKLKRSL